MPPPFPVGWGEAGGHIVPPLSESMSCLSVLSHPFRSIYFEKIGVLDSNFIHRYIIIKCRSSLI